jgi:hypothetical protein
VAAGESNGKGGAGNANSFAYTVERRERLAYFPALNNGEAENFFGPMINDATPVSQTLSVAQLDATSTTQAVVEVVAQGLSLVPHRVRVQLNGAVLGAADFDGQTLHTARFNVPQVALNEGANTVTLQALNGSGDASALSAVRITYARRYRAENDRLTFTAHGRVTVAGFTAPNVRVFDVTDPERIFALAAVVTAQPDGYAVALPPLNNRTVLALADSSADAPASIAANEPSSWTSATQGADLLIVTPHAFRNAADTLAAARRGQGLSVAVINVEDVYDEWNAAAQSTDALRNFLGWARQNWQQAPRYLLLLGDASYDPRDYLGFGGHDYVPTRYVATVSGETASDEDLVDFDGDGLGEMAVGRLPVRSAAQAQAVVAKLLTYQPGQTTDALLVADRPDGYDFAAANEQARALLPAGAAVTTVNRAAGTDAQARAQILAALNAGPSIVNYLGHGTAQIWAGSVLTGGDAGNLTNTRLPLVVTMTCLNGAFQDLLRESLAESLLNAPQGGAAAVWASSGLTTPAAQMDANRELMRLLYQNGAAPRLGDAVRQAKASATDTEVRRTWILLGDPTMIVR